MLFCSIISKRCEVGDLGSFPSLAVDSLASFMKSLPFSVFSVPYIGTACSASQSCWWMRCWSVWQSLNFLKDGRYKRAECDTIPQQQKSCCVNTLPEFSCDVPLFSFQAREGADKNLQVCGNHGNFDSPLGRSRIIYNMTDWSVPSILLPVWWCLSSLLTAEAR